MSDSTKVLFNMELISKSYKQGKHRLEILKDSSLKIYQGEIVALVGPSGSGKSTLLQIAGLLDQFDKGSINIDGIDCSKIDDATKSDIRLKKLGFVYQYHHLLPEFSAIENIALPLMIAGMSKTKAENLALNYMKKLQIDNRQDHFPNALSGGEQQRVAIARSLINQPKLILADEPTGNLDVANSNIVFDLFKETITNQNISALIVTHNMELAKKTDKIFTIKDKKIVKL